MEYYSAIQRYYIHAICMSLKYILLNERNQTQGYCMIPFWKRQNHRDRSVVARRREQGKG